MNPAPAAPGRVAGAPITWGVCEVPGWGHQMAAERVLGEMRDIGLKASEAGPDGFLPQDPMAARHLLAAADLALVGGFCPAVLHAGDSDTALAPVRQRCAWLEAAGADVVVLAADTGAGGYDGAAQLDDGDWTRLLVNLDRAADIAAQHQLAAVLHPHVGTAVERGEDIQRVLHGSGADLCLDTGHQLIGGTDPVALARESADRIRHVQLKDVDAAMAERVTAGDLSYTAAVAQGMYRPLGLGDINVAGVVAALGSAGYAGWYVLEQDVVLAAEPPAGDGPARDARRSLQFLTTLLRPARDEPKEGEPT